MGKSGKSRGGNSHQHTTQSNIQSKPWSELVGFGISACGLVGSFVFANALLAECCFACVALFLVSLLLTLVSERYLPRIIRWALSCAIAAVLAILCWQGYLKEQYHEQQAALVEGDLVPIPVNTETEIDPRFSAIKIGPNSSPLVYTGPSGDAEFKIAYDAGIRVWRDAQGTKISTPIRDKQGNLVGEIIANHWKVYPPYCSDKNYNKHSIEMKDESGHVVLQVTLFTDHVQLEGEWHGRPSEGLRLNVEPDGHGSMWTWHNPDQERAASEQLIRPIFVYPSSRHWGELVDPNYTESTCCAKNR